MIIQILGWIGTILFVYGVWVLGDRNVKGFYINAIANLLYAWQSVYLKNHPLFWLSIFLIGINLRGIYCWTNQKYQLRKSYKKALKLVKQAELDSSRKIADLYNDR